MITTSRLIYRKLMASPQKSVLIIGLENSGKSSLVNKIRLIRNSMTLPLTPTIGQNIFKTRYSNVEITFWDLGGSANIRDTWLHYYDDANLIYYVIDLSNQEVFTESLKLLRQVVSLSEEYKTPFCIILNKTDLDTSMSPEEFITTFLNNEIIPMLLRQGNVYLIVPTSASPDETIDVNIEQMLQWSVDKLRQQIVRKRHIHIDVVDE